jgi:hypothetical protein
MDPTKNLLSAYQLKVLALLPTLLRMDPTRNLLSTYQLKVLALLPTLLRMDPTRNLLSAYQLKVLVLLPRSSKERIEKPAPLPKSKIPFPKLLLFRNLVPAIPPASAPSPLLLTSNALPHVSHGGSDG